MFCTKCGAKMDDDAVFCPECGEKINAQEAGAGSNGPKGKNNKKVRMAIIGSLVILGILIAGFIMAFTWYNSPEKVYEREMAIAEASFSDGDYRSAIDAYDKAASLNPESPDTYLGLIKAYAELSDPEMILETYEDASDNLSRKDLEKVTTRTLRIIEKIIYDAGDDTDEDLSDYYYLIATLQGDSNVVADGNIPDAIADIISLPIGETGPATNVGAAMADSAAPDAAVPDAVAPGAATIVPESEPANIYPVLTDLNGNPYDLAGRTVIIRDWWSDGQGYYGNIDPASEEKLNEYLEWCMETYNFKLERRAITDGTPYQDYYDYVYSGGSDDYYVFILERDELLNTMIEENMVVDLSVFEFLDFSNDPMFANTDVDETYSVDGGIYVMYGGDRNGLIAGGEYVAVIPGCYDADKAAIAALAYKFYCTVANSLNEF